MPKLKKKKIVRSEEKHELEVETVRLSIEIPKHIRDNFREAVEENGKTMKDVLTNYMQKYVWKQGELERNRKKKAEQLEE